MSSTQLPMSSTQLPQTNDYRSYSQLPIASSSYEVSIAEQSADLTSIFLETHSVETITVQSIKKVFYENAAVLQEESIAARRRAFAIRIFAASVLSLGAIVIGGGLGLSVVFGRKNPSANWIPVVGGVPVGIGLLCTLGFTFYLLRVMKKELKISQMLEKFEKINDKKFDEFMKIERSHFGNCQRQMQACLQKDPRKFLEILYEVSQLFAKWKKIEESKQRITNNYGTLEESFWLKEEKIVNSLLNAS